MKLDEQFTRVLQKAVLWLVLLLGPMFRTACGEEFRLSLLDEAPPLEETCRVLRAAGVSEPTVSAFRKLVSYHNQLGNGVDTATFPRRESGFYRFRDASDLVRRLPKPFGRTISGTTPEHRTLMCFDVAALLLRGAGYGTPRLEQEFRSSGIVLPLPGAPLKDLKYDAFRTGYLLALCPEADYLRMAGRPRSAEETELALSLIAPRRLDGAATECKSSIEAALVECRQAMERSGFAYGRKLQIGFVYRADFATHALSADHAFVYVPLKDRLVCVEKTSPTGPFVRADFRSAKDLARYEAAAYLDYPLAAGQTGFGCPIVVTLDKRSIQIFKPAARLDAVPAGSIR